MRYKKLFLLMTVADYFVPRRNEKVGSNGCLGANQSAWEEGNQRCDGGVNQGASSNVLPDYGFEKSAVQMR